MNEATALTTRQVDLPMELTVEDVVKQIQKIQEVMSKAMKENEHYGVIPGTGSKPSLLKAGAEKLCLLFRLGPEYESTERYDGDHLTIKSKCVLFHTPTGMKMGSGEGSCSTKESKYAYRKGARVCPDCGKESIIKGKAEYGGGWLCFGKKGGCGHKWPDGAEVIEKQNTDRVANEDIADQYNTILKMANKRSLIAAVLNVTAASDIFTQDLEDLPTQEPKDVTPPKEKAGTGNGAVRGIKQKLGDALLAYVDNDKKSASRLLEDLTGKSSLKDLTDAEASKAMFDFETEYLHVEREASTEG